MSTPAWQKPLRWWAPWRRQALLREWNRQAAVTAIAEFRVKYPEYRSSRNSLYRAMNHRREVP